MRNGEGHAVNDIDHRARPDRRQAEQETAEEAAEERRRAARGRHAELAQSSGQRVVVAGPLGEHADSRPDDVADRVPGVVEEIGLVGGA